jgi:hypothetical protein
LECASHREEEDRTDRLIYSIMISDAAPIWNKGFPPSFLLSWISFSAAAVLSAGTQSARPV